MRALLASLAFLAPAALAVQCKSDSGSDVDWFALFKYSNSYNYAYYDSSMSSVQESSHSLDSKTDGAIAHTLGQLWSTTGLVYGAWNDETPAGHKSDTVGHSKGVVALDEDEDKGFYLLHSVPRFVDTQASSYGGLPSDEVIYAQSFICVSVSGSTMDSMADLFQLIHAQIYDTGGPTSKHSSLAAFLSGTHSTASTSQNQEIHTSGGSLFTQFAKTAEWGADLWADAVAPEVKSPMIAETWIRGDAIGPSCPPKYTYNVTDSQSVNIAGTSWNEQQDHSKWAVAASTVRASCIGDINRMTSQFTRGGGCLCTHDSGLHSSLLSAITSKDSCSSNNQDQEDAARFFTSLRGAIKPSTK